MPLKSQDLCCLRICKPVWLMHYNVLLNLFDHYYSFMLCFCYVVCHVFCYSKVTKGVVIETSKDLPCLGYLWRWMGVSLWVYYCPAKR